MPEAEKTIRNKSLYRKWKRGPKGYRRLAKDFGLDYSTVGNIIRREMRREANIIGG